MRDWRRRRARNWRPALAIGMIGALTSLVSAAPVVAGAITISIADRTVLEGDTGSTVVARFAVTLSEPATGPVSAHFETLNATATAPADYTARTGTVSFTAGQSSKNVNITVKGDDQDEATQSFRVRLSDPVNATIADTTGVGRITDDDGPTISVSSSATQPTVPELGPGQTTARVRHTVTLSAASPQQVRVRASTVQLSPGAGHATAGVDYTSVSNAIVTFAPNDTSETLDVTVLGDWKDEPTEFYELHLSSPVNASINDGVAEGAIIDDDCTGNDPGAATALSLGNVSGDSSDDTSRVSSIACNDEVDWYRFRLTENNLFSMEDLTARISLLVHNSPAQGGGNLNLCIYKSTGAIEVACSAKGGLQDEEIEVLKVDDQPDAGVNLWVKVFPRTKGPNGYTLLIDGDVTVTDPVEL